MKIGGDVIVVLDLLREKRIYSVYPAKEHFTAATFIVRPLIELIALQSIAGIEITECLSPRVELRQSQVRTQP